MPAASIPTIIEALALCGLIVAGGASIMGDPSMFALVGAGLAAFLTLVRNWKTAGETPRRVCIFSGVFCVGGLVPGAIIKNWVELPEGRLDWESWFLSGVIAGIFAWPVLESLFILSDFIPALARRRGRKIVGAAADRILGPEKKDE